MIKSFLILFCSSIGIIFLIIFIANTYYPAEVKTTLLPGVYIQDGHSELTANSWSVPLVFDWNRDGKKDLIVGNRFNDETKEGFGYVTYYENIGTDAHPSFHGFLNIHTCIEKCAPLSVTASG